MQGALGNWFWVRLLTTVKPPTLQERHDLMLFRFDHKTAVRMGFETVPEPYVSANDISFRLQ